MKVLGIVGSRRKQGNTSVLVQAALEAVKKEGLETELIFLGDYNFQGCTGCEGCHTTYQCLIQDDMQKLYPLLLEAQAVILGSPTYFYTVTADMKAFIDRCYCLEAFADDDRSVWLGIREALGGGYAAVIAVCEQHTPEDMGYTAEVMEKSLQALGYRVVSTVKAYNLFGQGEALQDLTAQAKAEQAGIKLAKSLKLREKVRKHITGSERSSITS